MQVPELSQVSTSSGHNCYDYYRVELGDQLGTNRIHVLKTIIIMLLFTMLIRAGMELGQVLSEEQRKERFSSCLRRKRAAQEVIIDDYDYYDVIIIII